MFALTALQMIVPRHQIIQIAYFEGDVLDANAFVQRELEADHVVVHEFLGTVQPREDHLRSAIGQPDCV